MRSKLTRVATVDGSRYSTNNRIRSCIRTFAFACHHMPPHRMRLCFLCLLSATHCTASHIFSQFSPIDRPREHPRTRSHNCHLFCPPLPPVHWCAVSCGLFVTCC